MHQKPLKELGHKSTSPAQSGRSMIEMLGVLAVIGVLSIASIFGYSYAMNKYRANTILNEVNLRAIDLAVQYDRGEAALNDEGWPATSKVGYTFQAPELAEDGFVIPVSGVSSDVCKDLVRRDLKQPLLDIDVKPATEEMCGDTKIVTLEFYFPQMGEQQDQDGCPLERSCGRQCCVPGYQCQDNRCMPICSETQYYDPLNSACTGCPITTLDITTQEGCSKCYPVYHWSGTGCCPPRLEDINSALVNGKSYRGLCYACGGRMGGPPEPCLPREEKDCQECPSGKRGNQYCKDVGTQCENRTPDKCIDVSLSQFEESAIIFNGKREKWYRAVNFSFWDSENMCAALGLSVPAYSDLMLKGKEGKKRWELLRATGWSGESWTGSSYGVCFNAIINFANGNRRSVQRDYGGGKVDSGLYALCGPAF